MTFLTRLKNINFPPSFNTQHTSKHQFFHRLSVYHAIKNISLMNTMNTKINSAKKQSLHFGVQFPPVLQLHRGKIHSFISGVRLLFWKHFSPHRLHLCLYMTVPVIKTLTQTWFIQLNFLYKPQVPREVNKQSNVKLLLYTTLWWHDRNTWSGSFLFKTPDFWIKIL